MVKSTLQIVPCHQVNKIALNPEVVKLKISNCPSTDDAYNLLLDVSFTSSLINLGKLISINFEITGTWNVTFAKVPIGFMNDRQRLLVSFECVNLTSKKNVFVKSEDLEDFYKLSFEDDTSASTVELICDLLTENLTSECTGVFNNFKAITMSLPHLVDSRGLNLLMRAIEDRNIIAFRELLRFPYDLSAVTDDGRIAADIAWENKHFQILFELLRANSMYPKTFSLNFASNELKEFYQTSEMIHSAIELNDVTKVDEILHNNGNLRYFYSHKNDSAMKASGSKEIYEMLINENCTFGPHEMPQKKADHINILLAKAVVGFDSNEFNDRFQQIRAALLTLDEFPECHLILKIIAAAPKNLRIHFDFTRPFGGILTSGVYYYNGQHSIIVKKSPCDMSETMSHEFCHYALIVIFQNETNPYTIYDEINKKIFDAIIVECKQLKHEEQLITNVFNGHTENLWPSELIATVPQMIIKYRHNITILNDRRHLFRSLFEYFNRFIMPAMMAALPILEKLSDESCEIKFKELTQSMQHKILIKQVNFQGKYIFYNQIILNESLDIFDKLSSADIRMALMTSNFIKIGKFMKKEFYLNRECIRTDQRNENVLRVLKKAKMRDDENQEKFEDIDMVISEAEKSKIVLLSDCAGSGKSATFRHIAAELKTKYRNYWICYVDLKQHFKIFEQYKEGSSSVTDETSKPAKAVNGKSSDNPKKRSIDEDDLCLRYQKLSTNNKSMKDKDFCLMNTKAPRSRRTTLSAQLNAMRLNAKESLKNIFDSEKFFHMLYQILQPINDFEFSIFKCLFNLHQIIFLFDNIDELSKEFLKFVKFIKHQTKNQIWLAINSQHESDFISELNLKSVIKLRHLNELELKEFIRNYMKNQIDVRSVAATREVEKIYAHVCMSNKSRNLSIVKQLTEELTSNNNIQKSFNPK